VGEYDFSHVQEQLPYIERAVSKKIVHPKYNFYTYEYDLALVRLEQQLEFAPHISPICLPATDDLLVGQNGTVTKSCAESMGEIFHELFSGDGMGEAVRGRHITIDTSGGK